MIKIRFVVWYSVAADCECTIALVISLRNATCACC